MNALQKIIIGSVNVVLYLVSLAVMLITLEVVSGVVRSSAVAEDTAAQVIYWGVLGFSAAFMVFCLVMAIVSTLRVRYIFSTLYSALPMIVFSFLLLVVVNLPI